MITIYIAYIFATTMQININEVDYTIQKSDWALIEPMFGDNVKIIDVSTQ